MTSVAYLPIVGDRYGTLVRHLFVVGLDLTGIAMRAQVRLWGDTPGEPLVDLLTVTNGNAEGLRLVEVTTDNGLPTSHVEIVINETTMEGLPYAGELGDAVQFAWDMQITLAGRKRRLAKGEFEITGDGVTGADAAPVNRPIAYGRPRQPISSPWTSARLTFGEEQVTVTIDGAELLAPLVKAAEAARDAVKPLFGTGAPAANLGIVGSVYYDTTDPVALIMYGPKTAAGWGAGRGLKGNPGGNVMSVGLFSEISGLTIGAGVNLIQTSGWNTTGFGAARYARTSATGQTPYRTQSADGGWWELEGGDISPAMFGGDGDPTARATAALAFLDARPKNIRIGVERVDVRTFGVAAENSPETNTPRLQAAIDACYGRVLVIPACGTLMHNGLAINPLVGDRGALPFHMQGMGYDANGGNGGSILKCVHPANANIRIANPPNTGNREQVIRIADLMLSGDGVNSGSTNDQAREGNGVEAINISGLLLEDLWIQNHRGNGVYAYRCYGSSMARGYVFKNRLNGLYLDRENNLWAMDKTKLYCNARLFIDGLANIKMDAPEPYPNLGVSFAQGVDFSYASILAFESYSKASGLLRIDVIGGQATAVTSAPHNRQVGDRIAISGSTSAPNLNSGVRSRFAYSISAVPSPTTFQFSVLSVPDGSYSDDGTLIAPPGVGLLVQGARGLSVKGYAEDCMLHSIYMGSRVEAVELKGGYYQRAPVVIDGKTSAVVECNEFTGSSGGLIVTAEDPNGVHKAANSFSGGAVGRNSVVTGRSDIGAISVEPNSRRTIDVACAGAAPGDFCSFSSTTDLLDLIGSAMVVTADMVRVTMRNTTTSAINLPAQTLRVQANQPV